MTAAAPFNPMGCRLCGIGQRNHAIQYGPAGRHTWQQPTQAQIKERMEARRAERGGNTRPRTARA